MRKKGICLIKLTYKATPQHKSGITELYKEIFLNVLLYWFVHYTGTTLDTVHSEVQLTDIKDVLVLVFTLFST
jgi:hypothetical protein